MSCCRVGLAVLAALGAGACSAGDDGGNRSGAAPTDAAAGPEAPPCPPEELSCGLQRPVVSDGARRFENPEMRLSAVFPAGSRVCLSRSGNAARGFYAWYGTDAPGCPERGDIMAASMSISSSFNSLDFTSAEQAAPNDCRTADPELVRLAGGGFAFPGHSSAICQEGDGSSATTITVYALAGESYPSARPDVPPVVYFAAMSTFHRRLEQDLRMFRAFLATIRLGTPKSDTDER